jgi:hypothetical protein
MSVAHNNSPYITIYKRSGDTFTKLANPAVLPTSAGYGVAFSPDGVYMSVVHSTTPFVTVYRRSGDTFTKLTNPASLPSGDSRAVAFSPDGVYMSIAMDVSPYIAIYKSPTLLPLDSSVKATMRLLTGGVSATDKDNEWDKIIVGSTLNGTITAGDNNVWNINSSLWSWTSTAVAGNGRAVRGNTTISSWDQGNTTDVSSWTSFRPVLLIESMVSSKYLLQDGANIYSINGGVRSIVGTSPVTESMFLNNGMDELSGITSASISDLTAPKVLLYKV